MLRQFTFLLFFLCAISAFAAKKYASPTGSQANSGNSLSAPWSLSYAFSNSSGIAAGDSLLLMDGVYEGNYISEINGVSGNPIWILAINPGKAIFDVGKNRTGGTALRIQGNHTWFIGLHVTSTSIIRKSDASNGNAPVLYESGITVFGDNNKLINCWIYDVVGGGLELWRSGLNLEVYGCFIFNNGSQDVLRGTGHGMYIQHDEPDFPKVIRNNFVFQNASQGINIYTTNPPNKGVIVDRNVAFNTGVIADFDSLSFRPPHNLTIGSRNNINVEMRVSGNMLFSDLQGGRLKSNGISNVSIGRTYFPNSDFRFVENILYGGGNQVEFLPLDRLEFRGNTLYNPHGSFIDFLRTDKSFTNIDWNQNNYVNISGNDTPFDDLSYSDWKSTFGFDAGSQLFVSPQKTIETLITKNAYEPNLYYVTILNFGETDQVEVDFSGQGILTGQKYVISDIQNPFDPNQKIEGKFNGSTIQFPMNWTKSLQPKGNMPYQVVHTDKTFGTFILKLEQLEELDFPQLKDSVTIFLNQDGIANLNPENLFKKWPLDDASINVTISNKGFDCSNLGENKVTVILKNIQNQIQEKIVTILVEDITPPTIVPKNIELFLDLTTGKLELEAADFYIELTDNCGIKEFGINRNLISCEDVGKVIPIAIRAVDIAGNVSEKVAQLTVKGLNSKPVTISGKSETCPGNKSELILSSEADFEVISWRRNGMEISNQKDKVLVIEEGGAYYAVIRYAAGCLGETQKSEVKTLEKPSGEIKEDGNKLVAPTGNFTYQWFLNDQEISGATERVLTLFEKGSYTVELTNQAGCIAKLQAVEVTIAGILGPNLILSEELKIFPNPAADLVELEIKTDQILELKSLKIYGFDGKDVSGLISISRATTSKFRMEISVLAAGTYLVILEGSNRKVFVGRFIKK